ncbi:RIP metalloprotease RseP [Helicobacter saguini]|uniref:Zinc metalloprotease n=1 Tax=Helicobacter saguini TaxID=1548018 RepID=A0A347VNS6_9HELI|nr:RIP metalloprotease RseP [Helicobacter saguini]MWV61655.1 RIP metalloprotease RseP [Helicobacter saguini]MWV67673.1 RIP metalloprotease RseP [Helicobacter saguini]MWV70025.1 RIP metalloprotease RseP [Helicobacter saguini]MWV72762.1 RIP metalloprotease RseP [Helicobacter saguini]TLD92727.1 RIP metalloprotease RseP [Helicobacter saguini]
MGIFVAILALSFIIFFHELGHFLAARIFGVKVLIFSLGFGKKIFSFDFKGTEYRLSFIPLGGYVKLKGEIENSKDSNFSESKLGNLKDSKIDSNVTQNLCQNIESSLQDSKDTKNIESNSQDSLTKKHPLQRIVIFLCGPLFNIILAFLIYFFLFANNGVRIYSEAPVIDSVSKDYLAFGILEQYDKIISINDIEVKKFEDITKILNSKDLKDSKVAKVKVKILRPKDSKDFKIYFNKSCEISNLESCYKLDSTKFQILEVFVPLSSIESGEMIESNSQDSNKDSKNIESNKNSNISNSKKIILGITAFNYTKKLDFSESIKYATNTTIDSSLLIYESLKKLIIGAIGIENLSGIIGITDVSAKAYQNNFTSFLLMLSLISINLGVINLLPLPMLDGGQIIFTLYEWLFRKPINYKVANILIIFGISFIICIMAIGIFNDIVRILTQN